MLRNPFQIKKKRTLDLPFLTDSHIWPPLSDVLMWASPDVFIIKTLMLFLIYIGINYREDICKINLIFSPYFRKFILFLLMERTKKKI